MKQSILTLIFSLFLVGLSAQMTVGTMKIGQGVTDPSDWVTYELSGEDGFDYNGVYVDVNTSGCGFENTPHYLVTLESTDEEGRHGAGMWEVSGYTAIYRATPTGFRVYARWVDGELNRPADQYTRFLTAEQAERLKYVIRWTAISNDDCGSCGEPNADVDDRGEETTDTTTNIRPVDTGNNLRVDFRMFPNPSGNVLNIESDNKIYEVTLYTPSGQVVGNYRDNYKINVANLPVGTYVVRATFSDGIIRTKQFIRN